MRRDGKWSRPQLILIAGAAILAVLAIAGCGGSSSDSSSSSEETSTGSTAAASGQPPGGFEISEETQSCLQESGVELPEGGEMPSGPPEGGEPPQGLNQAKLKKALKECGVEIPAGQGGPGGAATNSPASRKAIGKYVACVRENGYDLPEPNLSGEGPVFDESEVNQNDPKFQQASEKCASLLAAQGGG